MDDQSIIDAVLKELSFSKKEIGKFKEMLLIVQQNKKYGFYKDLRTEIRSIIERDDRNED